LCEDKKGSLDDGLLQNFDQLRTISIIYKIKANTRIFGVVSNLKTWIFTCYVVPELQITPSNFLYTKGFSFKLPEELDKISSFLNLIYFSPENLS